MKKKIVSICLVMALLAVGAVGMYAYFTDKDTVTNTFAAGDVQISLDEANVDEYGVATTGRNTRGNGDYLLIPGHTYTKDPTVTVAKDSETCYVRMLVKITDLADLQAAIPADKYPDYWSNGDSGGVLLIEKLVAGWDKDTWKADGTWAYNSLTSTYEFRYKDTVNTHNKAAKTLEPLFTSFTIPTWFTNTQIAALEELQIDVTAQAIQADTFSDAAAAWAAFDAQ